MSACLRSRCSCSRDGGVLVNEIAPRVHNSGHWTLDGASISQFEQHIRAVADWPLGKPVRHGRVEMINLIGDEINDYRCWLTVPRRLACTSTGRRRSVRAADGPRHAGLRRLIGRPGAGTGTAIGPRGTSGAPFREGNAGSPGAKRPACRLPASFRPKRRNFARRPALAPSYHRQCTEKEDACRFSSATTMSTRPSRR